MFKDQQLENLLDKIIEILGEDFNGSVGLRGDDHQYKNNQKIHKSHFWQDGIKTSKQLNGSSSLIISADWKNDSYKQLFANLKKYANNVSDYGDNVYVVIGKIANGGEDIGEIVIPDCKVLFKVIL